MPDWDAVMRAKGSKHYRAKLDEKTVERLLYGDLEHVSSRKAASMFNVSQSAIARIRSGRAWTHV